MLFKEKYIKYKQKYLDLKYKLLNMSRDNEIMQFGGDNEIMQFGGDNCKKIHTEKYINRPSPPYHANLCKNKTMNGNDGNLYISLPNKKGIYSWKIINKIKEKGSNSYLTVNNGSNFWRIDDFPKEKRVIIYKNNVDKNTFETIEEIKVTEIKYLKLWTCSSDSKKFMEGIWNKGSAILIQKTDLQFIIVYDNINEFKIQNDDVAIKFMNPMGRNDSPYPYLIGKKYVYFIFDSYNYYFAPINLFDLNKDVISQFLESIKLKPIKFKKLFGPCDNRWRGNTKCSKN